MKFNLAEMIKALKESIKALAYIIGTVIAILLNKNRLVQKHFSRKVLYGLYY